MNKPKTILAVGSIALDTLETPRGNRQDILGGSATYFSISAGLLAPVKLVGVVGNDFPEEGWQLFRSRNINTDNILVEAGSTFRWGGKYSDDYSVRDTLFTELGVFEDFTPSIQEADRLSPLVFLGNIHPSLQKSVAKLTPSAEHIVTDTMNLWIDLFPEKLTEVLKLSTILLINHEEAEQFTGQSEIFKAASDLLSAGPEIVVIKKGTDGAYLARGDSRYSIPVFPIKQVIDPTGAGDSFAGGFMGYLSQTSEPDFLEAIIVGSAMASFCVEGFGVESLLKATPKLLGHRVETIKKSMVEKV
jgi:sugar/nucleoside kinase (ribokinase family)